jgi:hypothetical protein
MISDHCVASFALPEAPSGLRALRGDRFDTLQPSMGRDWIMLRIGVAILCGLVVWLAVVVTDMRVTDWHESNRPGAVSLSRK